MCSESSHFSSYLPLLSLSNSPSSLGSTNNEEEWLDSEHILNVETTDLSIVGWKA